MIVAFAFFLFVCAAGATNRLTVLNPQQSWNSATGTIEECVITCQPRGAFIEYDMYLTFSARDLNYYSNTQLEVVMDFQLPENALLCDSWLWVGDTIVVADIIDKWTASMVYEGIVKRRRDPSLLTKSSSTQYQLRVYPMLANSTRKVKISYMVPFNWNEDKVFAAPYLDIVSQSLRRPEKIQLISYVDTDFSNPVLTGSTSQLTYGNIPEIGNCYYADIDYAEAKTGNVKIHFDTEVSSGNYLNVNRVGDENYYQLVVNTDNIITDITPRKVLVLFDYDYGKSNYPKMSVNQSIKDAIIANLTPVDSFKLLYTDYILKPVSDEWTAATNSEIDRIFDLIDDSDISDFSNLPGLLMEAVRIINETDDEYTILLVTTTDKYGSQDAGNLLVNEMLNNLVRKLPVYIVDICNVNPARYRINGINYDGNEYLNYHLARMSGGESLKLYGTSYTITQLLNQAMSMIFSSVADLNIHYNLDNGFCYRKHNISGDFSIGKNFIETGLMTGDFPFEIEITGFYRDDPFFKKIVIEEDEVSIVSNNNNVVWNGFDIIDKEKTSNKTNKLIQEIIDQSMDNRVLSQYTAFLALEPGMDIDSLKGEEDDEDVNTDVVYNRNKQINITTYPNPFSEFTTLDLRSLSLSELKNVSIEIFNTEGSKVYYSNNISGSEIRWEGIDDSGNKLPAGVYTILIKTDESSYRISTVLIR